MTQLNRKKKREDCVNFFFPNSHYVGNNIQTRPSTQTQLTQLTTYLCKSVYRHIFIYLHRTGQTMGAPGGPIHQEERLPDLAPINPLPAWSVRDSHVSRAMVISYVSRTIHTHTTRGQLNCVIKATVYTGQGRGPALSCINKPDIMVSKTSHTQAAQSPGANTGADEVTV